MRIAATGLLEKFKVGVLSARLSRAAVLRIDCRTVPAYREPHDIVIVIVSSPPILGADAPAALTLTRFEAWCILELDGGAVRTPERE